MRETSVADADGKGMWSRCPDAGIKSWAMIPKATVAKKPGTPVGTPGRARYKP